MGKSLSDQESLKQCSTSYRDLGCRIVRGERGARGYRGREMENPSSEE